MTRWSRTTGLLVVVGLLLLANPVWLVPHEGETRYTYERVPITIENGTLTYDHSGSAGVRDMGHDYNDLNAVGCQRGDADERACVFDAYLVTHGPVRLPASEAHHTVPDFVRLDDGYYRRVHHPNDDSTVTWDVERVPPRDLLAAVARNYSGIQPDDVSDAASVARRLAVTGGTATGVGLPEDDELGNVYYRNGSYYTVVVADEAVVDRLPGDVSSIRGLVRAGGAFLLFGAAVRAFGGPE